MKDTDPHPDFITDAVFIVGILDIILAIFPGISSSTFPILFFRSLELAVRYFDSI